MRAIDADALVKAVTTTKNEARENKDREGVMWCVEFIDAIHKQPTVELERIADLHREIRYRDQRIRELEEQVAVKDSIIKKQSIMLASTEKC
ncbi:hypothetical protein [Phascolarctobacterium sp.]|uniref:hypothetical protein n=1 Tax=Phascolarctobacterium sp. TaxID=2049039 RepID=UPI003867B518